VKTSYFESALGWLEIRESSKGIAQVNFIDQPPFHTVSSKNSTGVQHLLDYFNEKKDCVNAVFDLQGTAFQKKVWRKLKEIPFGTTIDYESLAKELGCIQFTRAVAKANSQNPIPILIPCHRVIGKSGSLTGYLGGLEKKEWLLKHEGVITQTSLF